MKFENEHAYNLTRDYMSAKADQLTEITYFIRFIETYVKFDEWLNSDHPIESANACKKPLRINPNAF